MSTPQSTPPVLPNYRAADLASAALWIVFGSLMLAGAVFPGFDPISGLGDATSSALGISGSALVASSLIRILSAAPQQWADRRLIMRMVGDSVACFGFGELCALAIQGPEPRGLGLVTIGAGMAIVSLLRIIAGGRTITHIRPRS